MYHLLISAPLSCIILLYYTYINEITLNKVVEKEIYLSTCQIYSAYKFGGEVGVYSSNWNEARIDLKNGHIFKCP